MCVLAGVGVGVAADKLWSSNEGEKTGILDTVSVGAQ